MEWKVCALFLGLAQAMLVSACFTQGALTLEDRRAIITVVTRAFDSDSTLHQGLDFMNGADVIVASDHLSQSWLESAPIPGVQLLSDDDIRREAALRGRICWLRFDEIKQLEPRRLETWLWADCSQTGSGGARVTLGGRGAQIEISRSFWGWRARIVGHLAA